jgi:1-pyrroline-5-carboxylate dehydrogenase
MTTRVFHILPHFIKRGGYKAKNYTSPIHKYMDKTTFEHKKLMSQIEQFKNFPTPIYSQINGTKHIDASHIQKQLSPYDNHDPIASYNYIHKLPIYNGIENHEKAKKQWNHLSIESKMEIMLKIADLLEHKYFTKMLGATIVGQGKTIHEANIDCIQELIDFLRFNVQFTYDIVKKQPISTKDETNISLYNPLQGFVASYTPFNFTAIAGNLATAPLLWGNSVFWKPSEHALLSNHIFYEICMEAGVHDNILNFVVSDPQTFTSQITNNKNLGAVLYTGSTFGFNSVNESVQNTYFNNFIKPGNTKTSTHYNYPRMIGETGGKNFHFVDVDANIDLVVEKTFQSAYGYSGQKCSACSRLYLPSTMWDEFKQKMSDKIKNINTEEYTVIHNTSFTNLNSLLNDLQDDAEVEIYKFHEPTNEKNYFIPPVFVLCYNNENKILKDELFGPILAVRCYEPEKQNEMIDECKNATPYSLTGAVFSNNTNFLNKSVKLFENNCGNFYINDKSTGAVVGQQPFGGFGVSGTNDKAGDSNFMMRLCHQRNIKINNLV